MKQETEIKNPIKERKPTYPEPTGDFWRDREEIARYAKSVGLEGERLQMYLAQWEGDALRRCDRLYYPCPEPLQKTYILPNNQEI